MPNYQANKKLLTSWSVIFLSLMKARYFEKMLKFQYNDTINDIFFEKGRPIWLNM